ncbi:MAG: DinB family protein [Gemmatimonadota bacterium]
MQLHERLIAEFTQEVGSTKRVLERVPEEKLSWKPHPKSMSLGQLAMHVANVPGGVATLASQLVAEVPVVPLHEATSREELFAVLEQSAATAINFLNEWGDAGLDAEWRMTMNGQTLLTMPRYQMIRSIMLNHWYHHRGELIVYLRLLDVPVPGIYGPSADENPFAS